MKLKTSHTCDNCMKPLSLKEVSIPTYKRTGRGFTQKDIRIRWVYTCECDYEYVCPPDRKPRSYWKVPHNSHK